MFGGVCGTGIYRVSNEAKNESLNLEEQISSEIEITEEKDINTEAGNILETESNLNEILEQNDEDNNYIDLADKYIVYKEGMAIVIEEKNATDEFYWEEYISYFNLASDINAYLCDKYGEKAKKEEDAYLYIDFGNLGEWWCDPFENLNSGLQVDAEFVSEKLVEKLKGKILESWYDTDIREMEQNTGIIQLTSEELEERVSEKVLNEIFAEYGEWQDYYEVDFDNDGKKDIVVSNGAGIGNMGYSYRFFYRNEGNGLYNMTFGLSNTMSISKPLNFDGKNYWIQVRSNGNVNPGFDYDYYECNIYYFEDGHPIELVSLTFDPTVVNNILCGEMDKDELEVDVAVKKKFINDFINMSYGPW